MRYMIIDIGSNTVKYDIFRLSGDTVSPCGRDSYPARLISFVENGALLPEGLTLLCDLLEKYKKAAEKADCIGIFPFATAAFRKIHTPEKVIQIVEEKTGLRICPLSGKEESELSFKGMFLTEPTLPETGMMLDMGGGSTEINIYENRMTRYLSSLPLGAGVIKNTFGVKDQLKDREEERIFRLIDASLEEKCLSFNRLSKNGLLVGGTAKACVKLAKALCGTECPNGQMTVSEFKTLYSIMKNPSPEQYRTAAELCPDRYRLMASGMSVFLRILELMKTEKIYICKGGIREGYLMHILQNDRLVYSIE